jgi:hypothetical protein
MALKGGILFAGAAAAVAWFGVPTQPFERAMLNEVEEAARHYLLPDRKKLSSFEVPSGFLCAKRYRHGASNVGVLLLPMQHRARAGFYRSMYELIPPGWTVLGEGSGRSSFFKQPDMSGVDDDTIVWQYDMEPSSGFQYVTDATTSQVVMRALVRWRNGLQLPAVVDCMSWSEAFRYARQQAVVGHLNVDELEVLTHSLLGYTELAEGRNVLLTRGLNAVIERGESCVVVYGSAHMGCVERFLLWKGFKQLGEPVRVQVKLEPPFTGIRQQ